MSKRKTIDDYKKECRVLRKENKTFGSLAKHSGAANSDLIKKLLSVEIERDSYRLKEEDLRILINDLKRELFKGGFNLSSVGTDQFKTHAENERQQHVSISKTKTPSLIKILKGEY